MFSKSYRRLSILDIALTKIASVLFGVAMVGLYPNLLDYGYWLPLGLSLAIGLIVLTKITVKKY